MYSDVFRFLLGSRQSHWIGVKACKIKRVQASVDYPYSSKVWCGQNRWGKISRKKLGQGEPKPRWPNCIKTDFEVGMLGQTRAHSCIVNPSKNSDAKMALDPKLHLQSCFPRRRICSCSPLNPYEGLKYLTPLGTLFLGCGCLHERRGGVKTTGHIKIEGKHG